MPSRPSPQAVARRPTAGGLRRWIPASALVLGLGAVAAIVASQPRLSASAVRERSGTAWDLTTVGGPEDVFPYRPISPFSDDLVHRSWLLTIVLLVGYFSSTAAIGSIVTTAVRGDDNWPRPVSAIASFLPGYVMVLAPLQVLFAAVPVRTASWIALAALPISAVALHWRTCSTSAAAVLHDRRARRNLLVTVGGVAAMTALALVHRLQAGHFFLTQDSIQWVLLAGENQIRGQWGPYLVQWHLQSDEWVFNAPLMFSSHNFGDLWFPIYATQCVSLVSLLALVFGIVHRFARRRKNLAGALTAAVVFGSTLSIYPWIYITIVIGGQPLVQLGHPGRHLGIIAPWIAVLLLGRQRRSVMLALAFATLGLAFNSLHVLLDVLAALITALTYRAVQGRRPAWMDVGGFRIGGQVLPVAALGAMAGAFWAHQAHPSTSAIWWLVLGLVIAIGGALAIGAATADGGARARPLPRPVWIGVWLATAAIGLLLSNNLTKDLIHVNARPILGAVLPGYDRGALTRDGNNGLQHDVYSGLSFPKFSVPSCESIIVCGGLADFLASFGVLFVLVLVTWISFGRFTSDAALNARRAALLILVAGLNLGLMIVFFTGAPSSVQTIIYTRFLEIPYYGLLGLATLTLVESRNRVTAMVGTSVLVLWTVIPLLGSEWPQQMARNASWYLERIF